MRATRKTKAPIDIIMPIDLFPHMKPTVFSETVQNAECCMCVVVDTLCSSWKNPFVFCELVTACPIMDDGDAKITSVEVQPPVVVHGKYNVLIFDVLCECVHGHSLATNHLVEGYPRGALMVKLCTPQGHPQVS